MPRIHAAILAILTAVAQSGVAVCACHDAASGHHHHEGGDAAYADGHHAREAGMTSESGVEPDDATGDRPADGCECSPGEPFLAQAPAGPVEGPRAFVLLHGVYAWGSGVAVPTDSPRDHSFAAVARHARPPPPLLRGVSSSSPLSLPVLRI